jgi:hypothetical protein
VQANNGFCRVLLVVHQGVPLSQRVYDFAKTYLLLKISS